MDFVSRVSNGFGKGFGLDASTIENSYYHQKVLDIEGLTCCIST